MLACLAVSRWALEECRSGNGPVLIEAFTYRMDAHTTSDDPSRYRLADELELWKLKDPLERVRVHLVRGHGVGTRLLRRASPPSRTRWPPACGRTAWRCPSRGRSGSSPHVYAEPSPELDAQRDAYLAYCAPSTGPRSRAVRE